jgi:hypothetical protein
MPIVTNSVFKTLPVIQFFIPVTDAGFFIRFNNEMCTGTLLDRDRKRSSLSFKLMFASACGVTSLAITATPSLHLYCVALDKQKCNALFQFSHHELGQLVFHKHEKDTCFINIG